MSTIKTALVVVLLLAVLYGVYNTLNAPPKAPPPEAARQEWQPPVIDVGEVASVPPLPALPGEKSAPSVGAPLPIAAPLAAPPLAAVSSPSEARSDLGVPPPLEGAPPLTGIPAVGGNGAASETAVPEAPLPNDAAPAARQQLPEVPNLPAEVNSAQAIPETAEVTGGVVPTASLAASEGNAFSPIPPASSGTYPQTPQANYEPSPAVREVRFERAWQESDQLLARGSMADALKRLTEFYGSPDLPAQHAAQLQERLDQLAGTVIYSTEHHLEEPYRAQAGETLEQVAEVYGLPVQLLANINGLKAPYTLYPAQELKVVRGPFRAEVTLSPAHRLTLFLGPYYAGRFDVTLGASPPPREGNFTILQKMLDRPYYHAGGGTVPANAPGNPYGSHWLGLEDQMCIHGSGPGADLTRGCIGLSPRDAADVYGILSVGSRVILRR